MLVSTVWSSRPSRDRKPVERTWAVSRGVRSHRGPAVSPPAHQLARLLVREWMAIGKQLCAMVPRKSHREYSPAPSRRDPVEILEEQAKSRLQQLVPIRYARMLDSSFAFLRDSAAVMAGDLATTPTTGLTGQACGEIGRASCRERV